MIKEGLFSHSKIDEGLKAEVSSAKVEEFISALILRKGASRDDVGLEQLRLNHSFELYQKAENREFLKGVFSRVVEGRFADEDLEYIPHDRAEVRHLDEAMRDELRDMGWLVIEVRASELGDQTAMSRHINRIQRRLPKV